METMNCDCVCGCKIISFSCLEKANSKLCDFGIRDHLQLIDAVNLMELKGDEGDGLLNDCFDKLCTAIKEAQSLADDYNNDPSTTDFKTHLDYLDQPWKGLVTLPSFKQMYASYIEAYYYHTGLADADTQRRGDINKGSGGNNAIGNGSYSHISHSSAKKRESAAFRMAARYRKFVKKYISTIPELCDCLAVEKKCCDNTRDWKSSEAL